MTGRDLVAGMDADKIDARLYLGAFPQIRGPGLRDRGFSMIAFCAAELQPEAKHYQPLTSVYAALDDGATVTARDIHVARRAAQEIVREWRNGGRILVTCAAGINRSAFVTAWVLREIHPDWPPPRVVRRIRARRSSHRSRPPWMAICALQPLSNGLFVQAFYTGRPQRWPHWQDTVAQRRRRWPQA